MIQLMIPTRNNQKGQDCLKNYASHFWPGVSDTVRFCMQEMKTGVLESMQSYKLDPNADILMWVHDDTEVMEDHWDRIVEAHFRTHPKCGLAGFGGAKGLGLPQLYKVPYRLQDLARVGFVSNMKDAEIHGLRTDEPQQIAMPDGFCLIFRREFYEQMGTWQSAIDKGYPPHHVYDTYASCMARRLKWETWLIPVACHHRGGETATGRDYHEWLKTQGFKDDTEVHQLGHRMIYDEFRDVLPWGVK